MFFFVLRHGQTDYNKLGVYQGRQDIMLNEIEKIYRRVIFNE